MGTIGCSDDHGHHGRLGRGRLGVRMAVMGVAVLLLGGCRPPTPATGPWDGPVITPRDLEMLKNMRFWTIMLRDPQVPFPIDAQTARAFQEHPVEALGVLQQSFEEELQVTPLTLARLSPRVALAFADQDRDRARAQFLREIAPMAQLVEDVLERRLRIVGARVLSVADRGDLQLRTAAEVGKNAVTPVVEFAETIIVGNELILMTLRDDELACIVGHELAHLTAGHVQERHDIEKAKASIMAATMLDVTAAATEGGKRAPTPGEQRAAAAAARQVSGFIDGLVTTSGWPQAQEYEADALAVGYTAGAGYDPGACVDFLKRIELEERIEGVADAVPSWGRTHPPTAARVERVKALAARVR